MVLEDGEISEAVFLRRFLYSLYGFRQFRHVNVIFVIFGNIYDVYRLVGVGWVIMAGDRHGGLETRLCGLMLNKLNVVDSGWLEAVKPFSCNANDVGEGTV